MHKNPVWLCFLTMIFLITCVYTSKAGFKLYRYIILSSSVESSATAWGVKSLSEEEFVPVAKYKYLVGNDFYDGETVFDAKHYKSPWAVEEVLKTLAAKTHLVWYAPANPKNSSLQRAFPVKEVAYASVLMAIAIYFYWLGIYVAGAKAK